MQWWLPIGGQTSTGKALGSDCKSGLTRYLGECNVCRDNAAKAETQEIKDESAIGLRGFDDIGGPINMVAVSAVSGTVLLGLLAHKPNPSEPFRAKRC
jgi:hypothetical protein